MTALPEGFLELPPEIQEAITRDALAETRHRDFSSYMASSVKAYRQGWFHRDFSRRLQRFSIQCALGLSPRMISSVPPRHGKTLHVGERLPAFHMKRNPGHSVMYWTHSEKPNAVRTSLQVRREVIRLHAENPRRYGHLRRDKEGIWSQTYWETVGGGAFLGRGVGGGTAGFGANMGLADDPFGNKAQAESATRRQEVKDSFTADVYSRLEGGGGLLVNHTRWHEDDLVGYCRTDLAHEDWEVVVYPALAVEDEDHRKTGEALCEWLHPRVRLERIRSSMPPRTWESLYQGSPVPPDGSLFRPGWFENEYALPPDRQRGACDYVRVFVDANFRETEAGSFFVAQAWGFRSNPVSAFVLGEIRGRWGYVDARAALRGFCVEWRPDEVHVEGRANGDALVDELQREVPGIRRVEPRGISDRKYRDAEAATALWHANQVYLPKREFAPWVDGLRHEYLRFPHGKNDDRVDVGSAAVIDFMHRRTDLEEIADALAIW